MAELPDINEWKEGHEDDLSIIRDCYCPSCGGSNGLTTILPTRVPFFREIILTNLFCDDCNFRSAEVNFGGEIQEKGEKLTLTVAGPDDLNRQIIKSDSCTLLIPKLDFEIPHDTQRGNVSTLEGVLRMAADNLQALQPDRLRLGDIDNFHRCRAVIANLRRFAGEQPSDELEDDEVELIPVFPFEVILDDPAGNSFIENIVAPQADPNLKSEKYFRTPNQDMSLGLQPSLQAIEAGRIDDENPAHKNVANAPKGKHSIERDDDTLGGVGRQEVLKFTTVCSHCYKSTETDMCVVDIPHFKEVIIMSMLCEFCGYKSNEIKGGGGIPKFGTKITLTLTSPDDLAREVLKSDTAGVAIPELDLELGEGGLDGLYTTIEGLLKKMRDRLESANPFGSGDSALKQHLTNDGGDFSGISPNHARYLAFLEKLKDMSEGRMLPFTLEISDPLSNSFIGPVPKDAIALSYQAEKEGNHKCYEDYVDKGMKVDEYERSHDQNEYLGLNDMKTENYNSQDVLNYGTDQMEEIPDRIRRVDIRGPDHPLEVGKAPIEGDTTVMGAGSLNFAVPSVGKRGTAAPKPAANSSGEPALIVVERAAIIKMLHDFETHDDAYMMNEDYEGPRDGMVYKDGAQGIGYYTNKPLLELWQDSENK